MLPDRSILIGQKKKNSKKTFWVILTHCVNITFLGDHPSHQENVSSSSFSWHRSNFHNARMFDCSVIIAVIVKDNRMDESRRPNKGACYR